MPTPQEHQVHTCECPVCQVLTDPEMLRRHAQINLLLSHLTEPQRRWYIGFLSQEPDSPSDRQWELITGLDRNTIQRGRRELADGLAEVHPTHQRRPGAGRPAAEKKTHSSK